MCNHWKHTKVVQVDAYRSMAETSTRRLFCSFIPVVHQYYPSEVNNEYVIRGNAAILKCSIPSFVAEFVQVVGWQDDQGNSFDPDQENGTNRDFLRIFFLDKVGTRVAANDKLVNVVDTGFWVVFLSRNIHRESYGYFISCLESASRNNLKHIKLVIIVFIFKLKSFNVHYVLPM